MKLYAPKYYKQFHCIADKCEHSCCIGWEIDIDRTTLERYRSLQSDYGRIIRESISEDREPHFKLAAGERCPHLNERGLCSIILHEGEDCLCDICREHPRFYNYTDVAEVGIGMCCREAARIILLSADYAETEQIGKRDGAADGVDFNGREERGAVYAMLQDGALPYQARLKKIGRTYAIGTGKDEHWLSLLASLEYLDEKHRALFMQYSSNRSADEKHEYPERFLAYLIYRHCTEAFDREDFAKRLGFCLFCERLFSSLISAEGARTLEETAVLASIISEEIEYSDENTARLTYEA